MSSPPFRSLNLGGSIGDDPVNVKENRARIYRAINRDENTNCDVWQVHGNTIVCTDKPRLPNEAHIKADGILTNNPGVTLMMRFADCVPILLVDPIKKVVGILHAGWQGTLKNITGEAISKMQSVYGTKPEYVVAGIGPSIGPDHYTVGKEVFEIGKPLFKDELSEVFSESDSKIHLDLWKANELLLRRAGIHKVLQSRICTACDTHRWFSHRAEAGKTGRFGALIGLKQ